MKLIVKTLCTILSMSIAVAFVSCGNNNATITDKKYKELLNESILLIPDSLLNEEQATLKAKLVDLIYKDLEMFETLKTQKLQKNQLIKETIIVL